MRSPVAAAFGGMHTCKTIILDTETALLPGMPRCIPEKRFSSRKNGYAFLRNGKSILQDHFSAEKPLFPPPRPFR
jgi:hypothetical protein